MPSPSGWNNPFWFGAGSFSVSWVRCCLGQKVIGTAPTFSLLRLIIIVSFYISEVIIGKPRFFYTAAFTGTLPVLQMPLESIKGRAGPLSLVLPLVQFSHSSTRVTYMLFCPSQFCFVCFVIICPSAGLRSLDSQTVKNFRLVEIILCHLEKVHLRSLNSNPAKGFHLRATTVHVLMWCSCWMRESLRMDIALEQGTHIQRGVLCLHGFP